MIKTIQNWLRSSSHVHLVQGRPETIQGLVGLIDRFLDDRLNYDLEWDDFISWKNQNPNIEAIRGRIALMEPLFLSRSPSDRIRAAELLIEERNRAAAIIGQEPRDCPSTSS